MPRGKRKADAMNDIMGTEEQKVEFAEDQSVQPEVVEESKSDQSIFEELNQAKEKIAELLVERDTLIKEKDQLEAEKNYYFNATQDLETALKDRNFLLQNLQKQVENLTNQMDNISDIKEKVPDNKQINELLNRAQQKRAPKVIDIAKENGYESWN